MPGLSPQGRSLTFQEEQALRTMLQECGFARLLIKIGVWLRYEARPMPIDDATITQIFRIAVTKPTQTADQPPCANS